MESILNRENFKSTTFTKIQHPRIEKYKNYIGLKKKLIWLTKRTLLIGISTIIFSLIIIINMILFILGMIVKSLDKIDYWHHIFFMKNKVFLLMSIFPPHWVLQYQRPDPERHQNSGRLLRSMHQISW